MNRREFLALFNPRRLAEQLDKPASSQAYAPDHNTLSLFAMRHGVDPANMTYDELLQMYKDLEKNL